VHTVAGGLQSRDLLRQSFHRQSGETAQGILVGLILIIELQSISVPFVQPIQRDKLAVAGGKSEILRPFVVVENGENIIVSGKLQGVLHGRIPGTGLLPIGRHLRVPFRVLIGDLRNRQGFL
jgi:hypothetical protein